jgi:hypothetical protein
VRVLGRDDGWITDAIGSCGASHAPRSTVKVYPLPISPLPLVQGLPTFF